ncbi:carcinoembryonic antigen-related cell adhesion molecule 1-like isoform X6 [Ctenopharyngodon idella]|uniref:carcinoembryonic antigen-related cell adhesion molecule 1-like isoform X6 n=1 Tax=Ctenopharyngodon idella TaxID=7959 RepID=UPI00222FDF5E|nr:carcinoembryonic antigen-related cell adhesion molecule 1-like isoform X6 [Ctenopharyngodon idella]
MGVLFIFLSVGSFLLYQGTSGVDTDRVSVMEGDSVTLHTGVKKTQEDSMKWYFKDIRIAQINGDSSKTCTDVQCKDSDERFRGRLKLDHQTGSLTITNITNTDSGEYTLKISGGSGHEKIFSVTVHGVSAAERDEMKRKTVKEGESVILDPHVMKTPNVMTWYFNDILITEITGDQSKICTDDQCEERFRDRLKLDHQTGSLTITNTRNTDSGEYKLEITSRSSLRRRRSISISSVKSFSVSVIDSGLSSGAVAGIVVVAVVVLLLVFVAAAAGVIYRRHRIVRNDMGEKEQGVIEENPSTRSLMTGEKTEVI